MDGYDYLAGFLLLFVFFIYITWFGFSVKVENQKEQSENKITHDWKITDKQSKTCSKNI